MLTLVKRALRRLTIFVFVMLVVEFLDEFTYSALEAARPLIRDEFGLTYIQISLITTIPVLVAIIVEPLVGLYADSSKRRMLMACGAIVFGVGWIVQGFAPSFWLFLVSASILAPASGVFVNIAQAALMDDAPTRRENRMALWTLSGSLAVVTGPLLLTLLVVLGSGWRAFFIGAGIMLVLVGLWIWYLPPTDALRDNLQDDDLSLSTSFKNIVPLLRNLIVWRWLILLEFSDLMLDVLFSLLALYMVDIVGVTQTQAGITIAVWTGVGLLGDALLIPLLEKIRGLVYLRFSAFVELLLFPAFLLTGNWYVQLVILALIGFFNAGWYAILQGKLYDTLGDQSGAVLVVGNASGIFGALLPLALGAIAQTFGLDIAMWFLLAGPIALTLGLPREESPTEAIENQ